MQTPESREKAAIAKYVKKAGAWFCRPATFGYGVSGAPDIIACHRGRFIGIEVKREGKEPTGLQLRRLCAIRDSDGWAFWGTAEKVIPELRAHGIS